jgi:hypothetical protein
MGSSPGVCGVRVGGGSASAVVDVCVATHMRGLVPHDRVCEMRSGAVLWRRAWPVRAAHSVPSETPVKPLRIFLHTVTRDLNWNTPRYNFFGENLQVAAALAERGYDFRFVLRDGEHNGNHDGVILPDALRWLWRPA